jgi:hypothetical protein
LGAPRRPRRLRTVRLTGPAVANTGSSSILPAVEQRKDLKIQPVQVASTDPAFISGLTPSGSEPESSGHDADGDASEAARPRGEDQAERNDAAEAADVDDTDASDAGADEDASAEPAAAAESEDSAEAGAADSEPDPDPDPTRPVFEALDHRGSVTIDSEGVRFTLDDQEAEWTWGEIAAVEQESSRFGRRLTVTVHTSDRRWYPGEVQAPTRSTLKKWTTLLDEVLDVYFPGEEEPAKDSAEDAVESAEEPAEGAEDSAGADETDAESGATAEPADGEGDEVSAETAAADEPAEQRDEASEPSEAASKTQEPEDKASAKPAQVRKRTSKKAAKK